MLNDAFCIESSHLGACFAQGVAKGMAAGTVARPLSPFSGPAGVVTVLRNLLLATFGSQFFVYMKQCPIEVL